MLGLRSKIQYDSISKWTELIFLRRKDNPYYCLLLTQYELSYNLIGSLDLYYQLILPFRSVMVHSQGR